MSTENSVCQQSELRRIKAGDLVAIFSGHEVKTVVATPRAIFNNKYGHFSHDDFIGAPFGSEVCQYLLLLAPQIDL